MTNESLTRNDYRFIVAVVDRILDQPEEVKFRRLKRTAKPVEAVESVLIQNGFEISQDGSWLCVDQHRVPALGQVKEWAQRMADSLLDPDQLSFRDVAAILERQGQLPGIRTDIDDSPLNTPFEVHETELPRKPWET